MYVSLEFDINLLFTVRHSLVIFKYRPWRVQNPEKGESLRIQIDGFKAMNGRYEGLHAYQIE